MLARREWRHKPKPQYWRGIPGLVGAVEPCADNSYIAVMRNEHVSHPMQPHEFIAGFQEVIARFGQWPSFHDGEVHRIVLDRTGRSPSGAYIPTVELHLRGWIMGPEATDEGFYKLYNDSVVCLLFEDIFDFEL